MKLYVHYIACYNASGQAKHSSGYKTNEQQNLRQWEELMYMCEL